MATRHPGAGEVLSTRALGRAALARQMLLSREAVPALEAVERVAGMQSQAPLPPYVGLWTRVEGFRAEELSGLIVDRAVVRIALMRSTIHLVSARDCLAWRPVVQPVLERAFLGTYGRHLAGLELDEVAAAGRALVEERPRTFAEVGARLAERWPGRDPAALAHVVRARVPLVQVPPRGLWGEGGQALHTSAEAWLGEPLAAEPDVDGMLLRYLAAYGPASVKDAQTWSGLTRLREAAERLRPRLAVFRDERGGELLDLPDAPRPAPDTPAPVRFLPEWENLLLSYADRSRILPDAHRPRVFTVNGIVAGTVLVDGFVRASWKVVREKGRATLVVEAFERLGKAERAAVEEEGARLLAFTDGEAGAREVGFAAARG